MALPFTSFRTTIGILVTGSTINPRIFISTSIPSSLIDILTRQGIGARARHASLDITSSQVAVLHRTQKVERLVLGSPPDPLPRRLVESFHQTLFNHADIGRIPANLNLALLLLDNRQPSSLLLLRDVVAQRQRGGVRAPRILEAEDGIVFHLVQQFERSLKI